MMYINIFLIINIQIASFLNMEQPYNYINDQQRKRFYPRLKITNEIVIEPSINWNLLITLWHYFQIILKNHAAFLSYEYLWDLFSWQS